MCRQSCNRQSDLLMADIWSFHPCQAVQDNKIYHRYMKNAQIATRRQPNFTIFYNPIVISRIHPVFFNLFNITADVVLAYD